VGLMIWSPIEPAPHMLPAHTQPTSNWPSPTTGAKKVMSDP